MVRQAHHERLNLKLSHFKLVADNSNIKRLRRGYKPRLASYSNAGRDLQSRPKRSDFDNFER